MKKDNPYNDSTCVGVHVSEDHANVVLLKDNSQFLHHTFNVGYDHLEECLQKVSEWMTENGASRFPIHLCITGSPVQSLITKTPPLAPSLLLKSFKLQMKQQTGEEPPNLFYQQLYKNESGEGRQEEYVVTTIHKEFRESIVQIARKLKLKISSWELDVLCYAKVAEHLWQKNNCADSSRFLIVLEWDYCQLFICHTDGQLVTFSLSLGMSSFMDRLVQVRAKIADTGSGIVDEDVNFPSTETGQVEQRLSEASQTIHEVYIPLAQQVKTQLYATCNEYGISLPTHFAVLGSGASLFDIHASLAKDFNLKCLSLSSECPNDYAVALGAMLKDRGKLHLNFMPKGGRELLRLWKEKIKNFRVKGSHPIRVIGSNDLLSAKNVVIAAVGILILASFPILQRISVSSELEALKKENSKLLSLKSEIEKAEKREAEFQKRAQLLKLLEAKRPHLSQAMKELISILPEPIKLKAIQLKGENLILKGSARSHVEVQAYLKAAQHLNYLSEPQPIGMLEESNGTHFEIAFHLKI